MKTTLEIFFCGFAGPDSVLYHRATRDISFSGQDPDRILKDVFQSLHIAGEKEEYCAHSTSWRYEEGEIILTYLSLVPLAVLQSVSTTWIQPSRVVPAVSAGPQAPRPALLKSVQVLIHGLGHLHYLTKKKSEPFLTKTVRKLNGLATLAVLDPTLAGRLQWV